MVIKIQDWYFPPGIAFTICRKSVPFTEKLPRKPETGIKVGFEEMEHEFSTGMTQKVIFHLLSNRILQKRFFNGKQPTPLHVHPAFLYISLPSLNDYDVKHACILLFIAVLFCSALFRCNNYLREPVPCKPGGFPWASSPLSFII